MSQTLLTVTGMNAFYGELQVLFDVNLAVQAGTVVALVGANGAGKSSLLESLVGLVRANGSVRLEDDELLGKSPAAITRSGLALVPEGRRLFQSLSIEENLLIGAASGRKGHWNLNRVYALFPVLHEKRNAPAQSLSGGQQQQAAIGRALMSNPQLLLCDEISLGLSPAIIRTIYAQLSSITSTGTAVMLVEQSTSLAMEQAQYVYCLREGKVVLQGAPTHLSREAVSEAYFGSCHV